MTTIHHHPLRQPMLPQGVSCRSQTRRIKIGPIPPPAQNKMGRMIPCCPNHASRSLCIDPHKSMGCLCREHRIHRYLQTPVRPVFKSHRHGEPTGHFPMSLTLRCPRPNCGPTHQIRQILRHNWIQKLSSRRHSHLVNLRQQLATRLQPPLQV